jgi:hypothetical protein
MGDAVFFVVCQPNVDMAIVRMTVDVVIAGWRKDSAAQKRLQQRRTERASLASPAALDQGSWSSWVTFASGIQARSG